MACYNISLSLEQTSSIELPGHKVRVLSRALEAAREAWHIRLKTLPHGHKDISDAEELVRRLEDLMP